MKINIFSYLKYIVLISVFCISCQILTAQKTEGFIIKGTVYSSETGEPLSSINVSIKLSVFDETYTNDSGSFEIHVPDKYATLVFYYPDYITEEVFLNGRDEIKVRMFSEGIPTISDEVKLAYSKKEKRVIVGSVSEIPERQLRTQSTDAVGSFVSGLAAGAFSSRRSGIPGSGANLLIRGATSINAGNQPLYVLDGLIIKSDVFEGVFSSGTPYNAICDINPEDVESITILKDGYSTAAYGTRAGNGVVLINTYEGTKGASRLDVVASAGIALKPDGLDVLNAEQYRELLRELGNADPFSGLELSKDYNEILSDNPPVKFSYDNNWQDRYLRSSTIQNYHMRLRGGDGISKYMFTIGYTGENGTIKPTEMRRLTSRFNLDCSISQKLSFGTRIGYTRSDFVVTDQGLTPYNPLYIAMTKAPVLNPYQSGNFYNLIDSVDFSGKSNPEALVNNYSNTEKLNRFIGNAFLIYEFNRNLSVKTNFGMDYYRLREDLFIPSGGIAALGRARNKTALQVGKEIIASNEITLEYKKPLNYIHEIQTLVGASIQYNTFTVSMGSGINTPNDEFRNISDAQRYDEATYIDDKWAVISYFGNVNYSLLNRYLLSGILRADGSSMFGENNRFGLFPGIAVGWIASSESFMQDIQFVDLLKLRASYGVSGNHNLGAYSALEYYVPSNYQNFGGVRIGNIRNDNLKWEETSQLNIGLDLSLQSQRFNISIDYYNKVTDDLLYYRDITEYGFSFTPVNSGKVENKGVEAALNLRILNGTFKWNAGGNITINKNTILKLPEGDVIHQLERFEFIACEGGSIGDIYGYKTVGIYQNENEITVENNAIDFDGYAYQPFEPGDIAFEDINIDGVIDKQDKTIIGNALPDFYGGFYNSFAFKGIRLDALFNYQYGNEVVNGMKYAMESMKSFDNQSINVLDRWQSPGDDNGIPRAVYGDPSGNSRNSTRWIEDGSFLRLKSVTLSYSIPDKLLGKTFIRGLTLFCTGTNLFTKTEFTGFDPEFSSTTDVMMSGLYFIGIPLNKTVMAGIRLGL
jgi:TonB-linked SusC/RagA family outer membrane protein